MKINGRVPHRAAGLMRCARAAALLTLGLNTPLLGLDPQIEIPIDAEISGVMATLCIPGGCDADASSVSGSVTIALDSPAPTLIELHDFEIAVDDPLQFDIGVFLGSLSASGVGLVFSDAQPGVPVGPVAVIGEMFSFDEVLTAGQGSVAYNAAGTVCLALQATGLSCSDSIDLSQQKPQSGQFAGTVVVADGVVTLTVDVFLETPLDPDSPELGSLSVSGVVTGSAVLPEPVVPATSAWGLGLMTLGLCAAGMALARRHRTS